MTWHVLHPCCRVRKEAFGLLFYDARGPKLLFAETGDCLDAEAIASGLPLEQAVRDGAGIAYGTLARWIRQLARKGIVREQPLR